MLFCSPALGRLSCRTQSLGLQHTGSNEFPALDGINECFQSETQLLKKVQQNKKENQKAQNLIVINML